MLTQQREMETEQGLAQGLSPHEHVAQAAAQIPPSSWHMAVLPR